jgi:kynurenine formamidase
MSTGTTPPRQTPVPGWERGTGWGWIWGDDDQAGALNAITPASVVEALSNVAEGRTFDLGLTIERQSFIPAAHCSTEVVAYRTPRGLRSQTDFPGFEDPEGVSFNTSMVVISDHTGTQIDGLCHATFGADNHWYNGYTDERSGRDFGPTDAAAENIRPIVVNGVLADVAGHLGLDELEPSFAIDETLLAATLAAQGVDLAPGEALFVRTGALRHWEGTGRDHAALAGPDTAGITLSAARWLAEEKGAILVASDTSTLEVVPPADGDNASPVHKYLLVDQGVHMGELHYLEDLAAAGAHRFCYVALAPKIRGTTAGFAMRPIAMV